MLIPLVHADRFLNRIVPSLLASATLQDLCSLTDIKDTANTDAPSSKGPVETFQIDIRHLGQKTLTVNTAAQQVLSIPTAHVAFFLSSRASDPK